MFASNPQATTVDTATRHQPQTAAQAFANGQDWRKSILFLSSSFNIGGAVSYLAKKANWLAQNGWQVTVASPRGNGMHFLNQELVKFYEVVELQKPFYLADLPLAMDSMSRLSAIVRAENVSIVESHYQQSVEHGEALSRMCGIPLVVICTGRLFAKRRYRPWVERWVAEGRFHAIYFPPLAEVRDMGVDISPCQVIPIPTKGPVLADEAELLATRRQHGIPTGATVISTVARLEPMKGYVRPLIEQFVSDISFPGPACLIVVGDGSERNAWQKLASQLSTQMERDAKQVIFAGTQKRLEPYYQMATVYVGQGTTALEAASCGVPVVLSTVPPIQNMSIGYFGDDEEFSVGETIPHMTQRPYSELISELLNSPAERERLIQQGQTIVREHFAVDTVMCNQTDIYERVLANWTAAGRREELPVDSWQFKPKNPIAYAARKIWMMQPQKAKEMIGILTKKTRRALGKWR